MWKEKDTNENKRDSWMRTHSEVVEFEDQEGRIQTW
jgi:hypothetical protein